MSEQFLIWLAGLIALLLVVLAWRSVAYRLDRANGADWGGKWLNRLDGLNRIFCRRYHGLEADTIHLPATGGALLAANHLSGLDPMLMIASCPRPVRFMIATEQYHRRSLHWLFRLIGCIPVDRSGKPEKAFQEALRALEKGAVIGVFPQGRIRQPGEGPVALKRGVVALAHLAGVPIIPLRISGIKGVGQIILSVVLRSRARIEAAAAITVADSKDEAALRILSDFVHRVPVTA